MEIPLEAWQATFDTQATEFLVAVRAAVPMMGKNGRIIAITDAPGGQTGRGCEYWRLFVYKVVGMVAVPLRRALLDSRSLAPPHRAA